MFVLSWGILVFINLTEEYWSKSSKAPGTTQQSFSPIFSQPPSFSPQWPFQTFNILRSLPPSLVANNLKHHFSDQIKIINDFLQWWLLAYPQKYTYCPLLSTPPLPDLPLRFLLFPSLLLLFTVPLWALLYAELWLQVYWYLLKYALNRYYQ